MTLQLRKAGWWLLDYAYALAWQTRATLTSARPADFLSGSAAPIVIIPGVYETWGFMQPLIEALHDGGHPVHVVAELGRNRHSVTNAAAIVAEHLARHELHGVTIVAHSKGGLIGKQLMTHNDPQNRVSQMTAISAPFAGSRYARYLIIPSLRAFSATDATVRRLGLDQKVNHRIVSIYGDFDPHIPEGSRLVGARNIRIGVGGHFRILGDPTVVQTVLATVRDTPEQSP